MIRVEDVETAASYYGDVFGLIPSGAGMARLISSFQRPMLKCAPLQPEYSLIG
jgi:hypothetical protein